MAVAALFLGQVHSVVGRPQQRVWVLAISGIEADADAHGDVQSMSLQKVGRGDNALDLGGDCVGLSDLANPFHDDHELVAADTGDCVALAHALREPQRNCAEQEIADLVSEGVVHFLETVDVHEQDGKGGT